VEAFQTAGFGPVFQVIWDEEVHILFFNVKHHHPFLCRFVPDDFRIPVTTTDMSDDRITLIFGKASATVIAVGYGLGKGNIFGPGIGSSCWSVKQNDRLFISGLKTGAVIVIHYSTARENCSHVIRMKGVTHFLPVNHIRTYGMSPGHVSPRPAEGIMLVKHVILSVIIHQTVCIIVPATFWCKMKLWS